MPAKRFLAGAATSNLTPPLGISINGGMADRRAEHIHDELHARCLVLDDGESQIGIVVCDSCMIPGEIHGAAKHLVHGFSSLLPDRILISATHAHSCPTVAGVFQSEPDEAYQEFMVVRIADGLRRALKNLAPAKIGWGVGQEPRQVFNRRWRMKPGAIPADPFGRTADTVQMNPPRASANLVEPAGPVDPEISLLSIRTADDHPLAVLANYSLHYVGGTGPGHISADYFGAFADRLQQLLGADRQDPPFVAMMSNGTSGNINNINFRAAASERQQPYEQIRRVAAAVAEQAVRTINSIEHVDWVPLRMMQSRLTLGRRVPKKDEVQRARFILAQGTGAVLKTREEIYARETVLLADLPATEETVVQAIRIGGLGIVALPCETFVETGLAIKKHSPLKPTFTVSLANDYAGYLPTVEQHALGGYETWRARSSFLEVEAEPKLRGKALELLADVAK